MDSVYLCEGGSGYLILSFRDIILRDEVFNKIKSYLKDDFSKLFIMKPNFYKKRNSFLKNKNYLYPVVIYWSLERCLVCIHSD